MNVMPTINKISEAMYNAYSTDGGKLLVHMGTLGWICGAFAQIVGVMSNKNIDSKQKKFLIPQEAADAAVNIGLFYTVCQVIKKFGDKIVEKGKFLTDDVVKAICQIKPASVPNVTPKNWNNLFTSQELKKDLSTLLSNPQKLNIFQKATVGEQARIIANSKKALTELSSHKNNVGIITSIAASVVAANILTPIARNYFAAKMQNRLQRKEDIETRKTQIRENITMKNPLPTSFKAFNNYNSFSGIKI